MVDYNDKDWPDLSSERAPQKWQDSNFGKKKYLVKCPRFGTFSRNVTLTLTLGFPPKSTPPQTDCVGIATGYGLHDCGVVVRVPVRSIISTFPYSPDSGIHPASIFPRRKNGRGVKLTTNLELVPRLTKRGSIPPFVNLQLLHNGPRYCAHCPVNATFTLTGDECDVISLTTNDRKDSGGCIQVQMGLRGGRESTCNSPHNALRNTNAYCSSSKWRVVNSTQLVCPLA
jgi:hypothetical protein